VADATADATPDAVADATPDAVADATPDAVPDAAADATPDAVPDAVADATPDATPDAVADGDGGGTVCTPIELTATSAAFNVGLPGYWSFDVASVGGANIDYIDMEFYADDTGTFDLAADGNDNYQTCSQCVRFYLDVDTGTGDFVHQAFAVSGSMTIDASTPPVSQDVELIGTVQAELVEVTVDGSFLSTPVDGGACYTLTLTTLEGAPQPPAQLQPAIDAAVAADGDPATVSFQVDNVLVTALKPETGGDDPGYFIQEGSTGPAVFVQEAEANFPAVGDDLSLEITEVELVGGAVHVTAFAGLVTNSNGNDVTPWIQDISFVDFAPVGSVNDYESELVTVSGVFGGGWGGAGGGFQAADLITFGTTDNLRMRVPIAVANQLDTDAGGDVFGCEVDLAAYPLGRFFGTAQPTALDINDVTMTCSAPFVLGAQAIGPDRVAIFMSRPMDGASITDVATQFTFDGGLVAASAAGGPQPNVVEITLAAAATPNTTYTVTVAETVLDISGSGVDPSANTADFLGLEPPPKLVINEVDFDMAANPDSTEFIEIYNPNSAPVDLTGYSVVLFNGAIDNPYRTIDLAGVLGVGAYAVIASQTFLDTFVADLEFAFSGDTNQIQNGNPDGIGIFFGAVLIDGLSYAGDIAGLVETAGAPDDTGPAIDNSLQRCPNGADTDDNSSDFDNSSLATPGVTNTCP